MTICTRAIHVLADLGEEKLDAPVRRARMWSIIPTRNT